jgi:two-component system nitrogen regulation response regulator NtrX
MAPHLLVIDPDPGTRQILREFLASAGFQSEEAGFLDGALARLAGNPPAAVVVHDGIEGAEGLEILEALRAHHPDLPVVFIAQRGDHRVAAGASLSPTACVSKPFQISDLLAAVVRTVDGPTPLRRPIRARRQRPSGRKGWHHPAERPRERTA